MVPRVVITGMGVVSPNGIGKEAFCLALLAGKSGVKRISRFDPSSLPVHIAGEIPEFDELAWVDARERKHVSRVVPLAIAASTEAIKDAGLDPAAMSMEEKREIGVILGTGGGAQEFSEEQYRLWHSGHVKQVSLFCIPSGTMGTLPSEISMRFGFRGYSHVVTAGCTSSTDAIGYAYQHIQAGVLPMFLVGGVDSPITPGIIKGYSLLRALTQSWNHAPESASRPFSADRDGFVIAEGSWMFILEDYDHARARRTNLCRNRGLRFHLRSLPPRTHERLAGRTRLKGDIQRGLEVVEFACGIPHLLKGEFTEGAGPNIDIYSVRQPLGVVAGITPFNFPAMIPLWKCAPAIACGNAFILKPSERDPSVPMRIAELFLEAGLPEGILNVVNGDKEAVDALLVDQRVKAIGFVGSSGYRAVHLFDRHRARKTRAMFRWR